MKILYYLLDIAAINGAYLHALGNELDFTNGYMKNTFRHAFVSALALQLIDAQLKESLHRTTNWENQYHQQIFEAERKLFESHLSSEKSQELGVWSSRMNDLPRQSTRLAADDDGSGSS